MITAQVIESDRCRKCSKPGIPGSLISGYFPNTAVKERSTYNKVYEHSQPGVRLYLSMKAHSLIIQLSGFLLGWGLCLAASNAAVNSEVTLKGIVDIAGTKTAFLEADAPPLRQNNVVLSEGER